NKWLKIVLISIGIFLIGLVIVVSVLSFIKTKISETTENMVENEYGVKFDKAGNIQKLNMAEISAKFMSKANNFMSVCNVKSPTYNATECDKILDEEIANVLGMPKLKLEL
uniref:Uncharacterized protein n=1 Tax=Lutzomyia longipalpis TaxID=7200 RepID=A0A1B0CJD8_LUTLO